MSLVFTHYDRTHLCDHEGMLGRAAPDGSRMCVRCGTTTYPAADREAFTEPTSNTARRPSKRHTPR